MLRIPTRQLRPTASPRRSSFRPILEPLEDRCLPALLTVTGIGDSIAVDGVVTLREAITSANNNANVNSDVGAVGAYGNDTITLPAGTYNLTIPNGPGGGENAAATGDLDITGSLTLTGAGAATTIIDAGGIDRVLDIIGVIPVAISGVTIRNGNAGDDFSGGGGVHLAFGPGTAAYTLTLTDCIISGNTAVNGGGINNDETQNNSLMLVRTTVSNNTATVIDGSGGDGGGIVHGPNGAGSLTLIDCIVRDNTAAGEKGGILAAAALPSDLTIRGSIISGNSALGGTGGGITWFGSAFVLTNSTVSGNTAGTDGGGISTAGGNVTLTNCTISGNTAARDGGGISSLNTGSLSGPYTLTNVTITNNVADSDNNGSGNGGGIFNLSPGTINLLNTIVGGNTDRGGQAPDCSGTITSQGHNLIQSTAGCTITGDTTGNITGQDPQLGPLSDNGGPTLTHLPLAGSPAIDAGTNTGAPATDQRGISRPPGAGVDIGAVEVGGGTTATPPPPATETITVTYVSREAIFRSELGLFIIDDASGRIGNLHPGDAGYAAAALARRQVIFTRAQRPGAVRTLTIPAGSRIAFYLVQNASSSDFLAGKSRRAGHRKPQVFFSITAANADRVHHVRFLSPNRFGFEDLTGGGDRDFNDLVVRITRGSSINRRTSIVRV